MNRTYVLFSLGLLMSVQAVTAAEKPAQNAPAARPLPRDLEIELALSALPAHLRDAATVYVLGGAGKFEIARAGSNGFHTFVARNDPNAFQIAGQAEKAAINKEYAELTARLCRYREIYCLQ